MKDTYYIVCELIEQLEFTWNKDNGANISVEAESTWEAYVKVCCMHPISQVTESSYVAIPACRSLPHQWLAPFQQYDPPHTDSCKRHEHMPCQSSGHWCHCKLDDQASNSASEDPNWPWTTAPTLSAVSTSHSDLTLNVDVA